MLFVERWLAGLAIAHVAGLLFFVCGTLFRRPARELSGADAGVYCVIAVATGAAAWGFLTFAFGMIGMLRPWVPILFILLFGVTFYVRGDSALGAGFWRSRFDLLRGALSGPGALIYAASLILSIPAVIPDTLAPWLAGYGPYLAEAASAHSLLVPSFGLYPAFASNGVVNSVWLFTLGLGDFAPFLTWLAAAMCLLGVFFAVASERPAAGGAQATAYAIAAASTAALLLNAMFLRFASSAAPDVQNGLTFFALALAFMRMMRDRSTAFLPSVVVLCGFELGMSMNPPTLFLLAPFGLAMWAVLRALDARTRIIACALGATFVLGSLWYAANALQAGWVSLGGVTADGAARLMQAMGANAGGGFFTLPLAFFLNLAPNPFNSDGATAVFLLLMLPGAVIAISLVTQRIGRDLLVLTTLLFCAILLWLAYPQARYALEFDALLCAFCGIVLMRLSARLPRPTAIVVVAVLLALPTPSSASWFAGYGHDRFAAAVQYRGEPATPVAGSAQAEYVVAELRRAGDSAARVYVGPLETLRYAFARAGAVGIGDTVRSGFHQQALSHVDAGTFGAWMNRIGVDAVLLPSAGTFEGATFENMRRQLAAAGFTVRTCGAYVTFLRADPGAGPCPEGP